MREMKGDLWAVVAEARVITTNNVVKGNGEAVMGAGCALQAKQRYPQLPRSLGDLLNRFGNHVHMFELDPQPVVSFPTKWNWKEPSDVKLIARSAHELVTLTNEFCWLSVVLPRPGCGLGQLRWDPDIKSLLGTILDNRFTVVSL